MPSFDFRRCNSSPNCCGLARVVSIRPGWFPSAPTGKVTLAYRKTPQEREGSAADLAGTCGILSLPSPRNRCLRPTNGTGSTRHRERAASLVNAQGGPMDVGPPSFMNVRGQANFPGRAMGPVPSSSSTWARARSQCSRCRPSGLPFPLPNEIGTFADPTLRSSC
jgi:hypothetical protein